MSTIWLAAQYQTRMYIHQDTTRIESEITPAELLYHLGIKIHDAGGVPHIKCPSCNDQSWLLPYGIFCRDKNCRLLAAGTLDLAAIYAGSFSGGLRRLMELFPGRKDRWGITNPSTLSQCARSLSDQRKLFDFFREHRAIGGAQELHDLGILNERLTSWGYSPGYSDLTIFALGKARLKKLLGLLENLHVDTDKVKSPFALAIPWFGAHHQIGSISFYDPAADAPVTHLTLQSKRYLFAGLLNSNPEASRIWLTSHFAHALHTMRILDLDTSPDACMAVKHDRFSEDMGHMPDSLTYLLKSGESPQLAANLAKDRPDCQFAVGSPDSLDAKPVPWFDFVSSKVMLEAEAAKGGVLTAGTKVFVQASDLGLPDKQRLLRHLTAAGHGVVAQDLTRVFQTVVLYQDPKIKVLETPDGYQAVRRKQHLRETISNFVLQLNRNVLFEDRGEIFHAGRMLFAGDSYPVLLSIDDMESPAALQKRVQGAFVKKTGSPRPASLPMIRDRSLFRFVSTCLREVGAAMPSIAGMASLGWHHSRDAYNAPCWRMTADGLLTGPFPLHPNLPALSFFESSKYKAPTPMTSVPPAGIADLARLILAGIVRDFLNMRIEGIPIRQDRDTQQAVEVLFRRLGQTRPINFNGPDPDGVGRFPVYGFDYKPQQLRQASSFVMGLGDHGMPLADLGGAREEQLPIYAGWLEGLMIQLVEHLLVHGGSGFERVPRVLYTNELLSEGDVILSNIFGIAGLPSQPVNFETIECLLQDMGTTARIPDLFAYDHKNQLVRLYHTRSRVSPESLELELRRLSPVVTVYPDHMTVAPPVAYSVLQHYFGTSEIRIPELATTIPPQAL